jgi:hypothetical protein
MLPFRAAQAAAVAAKAVVVAEVVFVFVVPRGDSQESKTIDFHFVVDPTGPIQTFGFFYLAVHE